MSRYRDNLPQLGGGLFLTDGGLETTLIFHQDVDLPEFASFPLLDDEDGVRRLREYFETYLALARESGAGFVLESPTWRASARWGEKLGYTPERLDEVNRKAIALLEELRDRYDSDETPVVISGCLGPHDDAYDPEEMLSADAAEDYHSAQIRTFAGTEADMVNAMTLTYVEEGIGVARAAKEAAIPACISFTVETDGKLPSGQPLGEAIEQVDAETGNAPAYFMINCAHPTHFDDVVSSEEPWTRRVRALRANASTMSHAELDEAEELDDGDPVDLGARYRALRAELPELCLVGGCCGTDHRHVAEISKAWA
jgi:S-methylmethionine-dependent homocysteine/selenocysteine methylase